MLSRSDLAKGYKYEKGKFVCVDPNELAGLLPPTAHEIDVREFCPAGRYRTGTYRPQLLRRAEPGQRAYAVLLEALCSSGLVGVAQVAMHSRESVLVLRPCGNSMIAQTLFYEAEIRRERQYCVDRSLVAAQELALAVRLIEERTVRFEPLNYVDNNREAVQALVRSRIEGQPRASVRDHGADDPLASLLQALEQSVKPAQRKVPTGAKVTTVPQRDSKRSKAAS